MNNKKPVIISLLLGVALFAGSGDMYSDVRRLLATAEKAPGTVVEFATASGEIRRFTTSGAGDYIKGQVVEVLYDANDPGKARVNVFIELWLGTLALGVFGLLCLGVGIGTMLYERGRMWNMLK